jgi:hypothetical protein
MESSRSTMFLTDLGGIPTLSSLVDNSIHEWVRWMHDYLAELTARSIYRARGRWRPILRRCAGGRSERRVTGGNLSWRLRGNKLRRSLGNDHDSRQRGKVAKGVARSRKTAMATVMAVRPRRRQVNG